VHGGVFWNGPKTCFIPEFTLGLFHHGLRGAQALASVQAARSAAPGKGATVRELLGRLSALDHNAESAVRVIAYFDALIDGHAGLDALVRGAAALAGCPAGLRDQERHLRIRIDADGHRLDVADGQPWRDWPNAALDEPGLPGQPGAAVWLERSDGEVPTDAMILERFAAGARVVLDRTRSRAVARDPALVEVLIDADADPDARARAAHRLGLATGMTARIVATMPLTGDPSPGKLPAALDRRRTALGQIDASVVPRVADWTGDPLLARRVGVGPLVAPDELPRSWEAALVALRLTADGTASSPGPRQLCYDDLGGLALVARSVSAAAAQIDDVAALELLGDHVPWALATLDAVAEHASLRRAATALHVHHSTLQERASQLERMLGYAIDTAAGHNRLYLALILRRLHLNGDLPAGPRR
jgi:hypothetical protein